jgi:hypothetical protein
MASKTSADIPELFQQPLYLYDLPKELLETLTLKDHQPAVQSETSEELESRSESRATDRIDAEPSKATSCSLCGLSFVTLQEQRQHVKSDLHNYNLKQKLRGLNPVSEVEFDKLIGDLDESISGSDSESESDNDGSQNPREDVLVALLKKQAKVSKSADDSVEQKPGKAKGSPFTWFGSSLLPDNMALGVYSGLLPPPEQGDLIAIIKSRQLSPILPTAKNKSVANDAILQNAPTYFLCMIGGGHFAAMIVSLTPKTVGKHNGRVEREAVVIAHKTFHRYTTRRKQGGSQSMSDGAKGAAQSAGSSLRRANEMALTAEIRSLLISWKPMIDKSELLFIRGNSKLNHKTLFGQHEGQVLNPKDPRIRGFPFTTRRATQSELIRAFTELTRLKVNSNQVKIVDQETTTSQSKKEAPKKVTPKKRDPEEEAAELHTTQLTSLIKRSKIPTLLSYIRRNEISLSTFKFYPEAQHRHAPSPLHYAASMGIAPVITALLTKADADPTLKNEDGKTASDIAKDRATRDAFRGARYDLGESKWPWGETSVGSALSPSEIKERDAKDQAEAAAEVAKEAERRKEEVQRLRQEDAERENSKAEKKHGKGMILGQEETGAAKRELEARGMTPEMRQRLERERRARAVEERLRRMQAE